MRVRRIIAVSCCATGIAFVLLFLLAVLDDEYSPALPPVLFRWVVLVVDWPLYVTSKILHRDPPPGICWWALLFAAGLFWGFVVEIFFVLKKACKS
jgi:hypothetical protein